MINLFWMNKGNMYNNKHDWILPFLKKNPYPKFLATQNCIKKDLDLFSIFLLKKVISIMRSIP